MKVWSITSMNPQWIYVYMDVCAFLESNKCKANPVPHYLSVFRRKRGPLCGCPSLLMQKNVRLYVHVGFRGIEWRPSLSMQCCFAYKGIFIGCFVGGTINKIFMVTGKLIDNIRVTNNGLWSGVDRMSKSSESAFYRITDRLNLFRKSVELDILFLYPLPGIRLTCIQDNIKVLAPWKWDRFPEFLAFA